MSGVNFDKKKQGYVFNIQHYSVHDGPGIRTIVFLKGCPLKCKWCSNPESQRYSPELAYNSNKCIGIIECMRCLEVCVYGAITRDDDNKIIIDRQLCQDCFSCADACPSKALHTFGDIRKVKEVIDVVEKDSAFYRSEGGMTISGGEPLLQADFTVELLKEAKRRRINTNIETCGYAEWEDVEKACQYLDNIYYDIKCFDSAKHKEQTGVPNEKILANLKKIAKQFPNLPITVRTPVVPGFNDTVEDIQAIIDFIKDIPNLKQYELLAYHRLGEQKYTYIGKEYPLNGIVKVDEERMATLNKLVKDQFNK